MGISGVTNGPDPRNSIGCCDPCSTVRQGGGHLSTLLSHIDGGAPHPMGECCRCVPRAVTFQFEHASTGVCCYSQSHIVHPYLENTGDWLKAVYEDNLFGKTFELSVGRFSLYLDASGYEDPTAGDFNPSGYCNGNDPYDIGECSWRLRVYETGVLEHYQTYAIESEADCLTPSSIQYGPIEWPPGCSGGYVSFYEYDKIKLPYIQQTDTSDEYLVNLCPTGCSDGLPTCISVQEDNNSYAFQKGTDISGNPSYLCSMPTCSGNNNTVWWDGENSIWTMLNPSYNRVANGGSDSGCPLGVWNPIVGSDIFCVSPCHSGVDNSPTDVNFVCGQCVESCQNLCVNGNWRENGWEFLNFEWFKQIASGTHPNNTLQQGWRYYNTIVSGYDYLWFYLK
jgi:hypothetical protein